MKRKVLSLILAVLMALGMFGSIPALAASIRTSVTTTNPGDTLRVRKGPHKGDTPTVDFVVNRQSVILMDWGDEDDPEDWAKIKVVSTGAIGYLKNKYIRYFALDNYDGELDPDEDDDEDYRYADDNDGRRGSSTGGGSSSSSISGFARVNTNGGSVNVRKSASSSGARLGTASNGERLSILSKKGSWYRVKTAKGLTGYVYGSYVSEGAYAHTTARVNFRKGAGTGYGVIRTLPTGTSFTAYYNTGKWTRAKVGSTYGYIYNTYYSFG